MTNIALIARYIEHILKQAATQEVNAARQYYGASRAAVATNTTFTKQAKQLAARCGVELWERF